MNYLLRGILILITIMSIGAFVQWLIVKNIGTELFYSIRSVYAFHSFLAISICCAVFYVNKWQESYVGYTFLAGSVLQMLFCILFLIPLISAEMENKIPDVFSFMFPYFICLTAEVIFSVILIKKNTEKKLNI